jgi:ABC-type transport system involved in cytochrome c biogenesis permease subunit
VLGGELHLSGRKTWLQSRRAWIANHGTHYTESSDTLTRPIASLARLMMLTFIGVSAAALPAAAASGGEVFDAGTVAFLTKVDSWALGSLGVQMPGRIAIFETLAAEQLDQSYGDDGVDGIPAAAAYLELYFRSGEYVDKPVIYIRERNMRAYLAGHIPPGRVEQFNRTHRIAPVLLLDDEAWMLLFRTGRADRNDYTRAAGLGSLRDSLAGLSERKEFRLAIDRLSARYSSFLADGVIRLAPAPGGEWTPAGEVFRAPASAPASTPAIRAPASAPAIRRGGPAPAAQDAPAGQWRVLCQAWLARDAQAVNKAIARLEVSLPHAAGPGYPSAAVRSLERLYGRTRQFTFAWGGYAISLVLFIIAAASGAAWARKGGLGVFSLCTLIMLAGFIIRWILSGRAWYLPPLMNQFEAVSGSALLGAVIALMLERLYRRNFFVLAAAFYATACWVAQLVFPEQMSGGIRAQHGILSSPVMAVHVSVIIIGHALVGMTFVISLAYLVVAMFQRAERPSSPADLRPAGQMSTLAIIDRSNLIVAQIAAWSVVAGTILGAYWGDFAWGRWWGWDPKETWALITALVYVVMLHIRFLTPPRWRGLVTALICILGTAVMLFNWIVVNFLLSGKHSYA